MALDVLIKYEEKERAELKRPASELTSDGFRERRFVHLI